MLIRIVLAALLWPAVAFGQTCAAPPATLRWTATALDGAFEAAGHQFRVDPDLGRAVTWVESRANAAAVSPKGAQGLMQLMPGTSGALRVMDPLNPHQSIYGGMNYLRQLANDRRFAGNPYMALVAYNAGPNRTVFPKESYQYADQVVAVYWHLKAAHGLFAPSPLGYLRVPRCDHSHVGVTRIILSGGKVMPSRHYLH